MSGGSIGRKFAFALVFAGSCMGLSGAENQVLSFSDSEVIVSEVGQVFSLGIDYSVSDSNTELSGVNVRVHYDSSKLDFEAVSEFKAFTAAFSLEPDVAQEDSLDFDGNAETDRFLRFAWADFNGGWPGVEETLPLRLANVSFQALEGVVDSATTLGFSVDETDPAYGFSGGSTTVSYVELPKVQTLDLTADPAKIGVDEEVSVSLIYDVEDGNKELGGLNVRLYFDSGVLDFGELLSFESFGAAIVFEPENSVEDSDDGDSDLSTDSYIQLTWADFNLDWPGEEQELPLEIASVSFLGREGLSEAAGKINVVVVDNMPGYAFEGTGVEILADIDEGPPPSAPVFSLQPAGLSVTAPTSFVLSASATGVPAPTYQWSKDGEAIEGAMESSYTVAESSVSNSGVYRVKATNASGSVVSEAASVAVESPATSIDLSEKSVGSGATSYEISVFSNTDWMVSGLPSWASAEPSSGSGNGTVVVGVQSNLSTSSRSETFTIGGEGHELVQAASDYLLLSVDSLEITAVGGSRGIDISSNQSWVASTSSDWLGFDGAVEGSGDGTIVIAIAENPGLEDREGIVMVGGKIVIVTQFGGAEGIYFSDESIVLESVRSIASSEESSYAGLWLPDDESNGALIGVCMEGGSEVSFAYVLLRVDDNRFQVLDDELEVAMLVRDRYGVLTVDLPCIGEMTFSKVDSEEESEYSGFYEADTGDGSGAKIYVLVAPNKKLIAVAPKAIEKIAVRGEIAADGLIVVDASNAEEIKKIKIARPSLGSVFTLATTSLDRERAKLPSGASEFEVDVLSLGAWTISDDADWLSASLASGSGSHLVRFSAAANESSLLRIATVQVGSEELAVRQHGRASGATFEEWVKAYYLESEASEMKPSAAEEDSDYDGLSNAGEWKLDLDPTEFSSRLQTRIYRNGEKMVVEAWPLAEASEVILQTSTDFKVWSSVEGASVEVVDGVVRYEIDVSESSYFRFSVE